MGKHLKQRGAMYHVLKKGMAVLVLSGFICGCNKPGYAYRANINKRTVDVNKNTVDKDKLTVDIDKKTVPLDENTVKIIDE